MRKVHSSVNFVKILDYNLNIKKIKHKIRCKNLISNNFNSIFLNQYIYISYKQAGNVNLYNYQD